MNLRTLLQASGIAPGLADPDISSLCHDSRLAKPGCLFFALPGAKSDGTQFIAQAVERGAAAVVAEHSVSEKDCPLVLVDNARAAMADISAEFYGHPDRDLKCVGITGTNGKTTTAYLVKHIFDSVGFHSGLIGTVKYIVAGEERPATHTTPESIDLQQMLAEIRDTGGRSVAMEVSSHALVQNRVRGMEFDAAIFTNLTQDHLDYHETMDNYVAAKKMLFDGLGSEAFALVNSDDTHGETMLLDCAARTRTYALKRPADIKVKILESHLQGTLLSINQRECWSQLIGAFNAYNMAAMYGVAVELGIPADEALQALSAVRSVDGRFQKIAGPDNRIGIVDYAHTPDALENVLKTLQDLNQGAQQIITVIGCGGDRDKGKRPEMARIAADRSTKAILTSDNPRSEDPEAILDDMEAGLDPVQKRRSLRISDRAQAIKLAVQLANPGDVILVAGKGHETYQEIAGVKHPFDDVATLKAQFNDL